MRSLNDIEQAFSCKLLWKLENNVGVWAKFVNQVSLDRSVMHHRLALLEDFMTQHISVRIGDGSSFFWTSNWMYLGPLLAYNPDPHYPDLTLSQAFEGGQWQRQFICGDLPHSVLQAVLSITLYFVAQPDTKVWNLTAAG